MYRLGIVFFLLPVLFVLQACSNLGGAAFDGVKAYYSSAFSVGYASQPLDPRYVYLEVVSPTASALMVLATVDQPTSGGMPVETWVSASREVLRTQGGLVVGSEGVPKVLQQADVQRNAQGEPISWVLNSPSGGVYQLKQQLTPLPAETFNLKSTPLMKRAAKQAGFSLQAWQGTNTVAGPAAEFNNSLQVLGTVKGQADWVYGQHCPTPNYCIEYLRRTAAQNL